MKTSSFYCGKKKCRKTAWDTPEYMTEEDWDLVAKVIKVLETGTSEDFVALMGKKKAKDFFDRIVGWPEGYVYCQDFGYVKRTGFPGLKKHDLLKLKEAIRSRK